MILNKEESKKVIKKLVNDPTITDDYWEEVVQHIRDDLCYYLDKDGEIDVDKIAKFHGPFVYEIVKRYLGDE